MSTDDRCACEAPFTQDYLYVTFSSFYLLHGCPILVLQSLASTCPSTTTWKILVILKNLVQVCLIGIRAELCRTVALEDWTP